MSTCSACRAELKPGAQFCPHCGARQTPVGAPASADPQPVGPTCPACGHPLKPGARFCGACGQALEVASPVVPEAQVAPGEPIPAAAPPASPAPAFVPAAESPAAAAVVPPLTFFSEPTGTPSPEVPPRTFQMAPPETPSAPAAVALGAQLSAGPAGAPADTGSAAPREASAGEDAPPRKSALPLLLGAGVSVIALVIFGAVVWYLQASKAAPAEANAPAVPMPAPQASVPPSSQPAPVAAPQPAPAPVPQAVPAPSAPAAAPAPAPEEAPAPASESPKGTKKGSHKGTKGAAKDKTEAAKSGAKDGDEAAYIRKMNDQLERQIRDLQQH
ncbi:zinc ribbon domain-containing protein [Azospira inquinata]|uniref:Zinc ribbon domain-containing protein n=2 Tax=Azospira inquinata TaxID=2785627 RepID=A0A975SP72_9RHOO|nr:zinc ribbon domain-containing protein [Azospira inquinata]QWT49394.1 zinc ribbon domain-containing protein [Azospira inquinata]